MPEQRVAASSEGQAHIALQTLVRTDWRLYDFPHVLHANGFSRVCVLMCLSRCSALVNVCPHSKHFRNWRPLFLVCPRDEGAVSLVDDIES
jgi:hypothetical protein